MDKRKAKRIVAKLHQAYPGVTCALHHRDAYQLLVATILSAQCTDQRVNMVTPALFERYPTPADLATADQAELEQLIRSTGFFRNKAKNLIGMARAVVSTHGGKIPRTLEELVELPGVARKTANVVMGTAFGIPSGIVVDTHVTRITGLLGMSNEKDPVKIERDLMVLLPREEWINFSHMVIHHGRQVCVARRPMCDMCSLNRLCISAFAKTSPKTKGRKTRSHKHTSSQPAKRRR